MCCITNIFINAPMTTMGRCSSMIRPCGVGSFSPGCFGYGFCSSPMTNMAMMGIGMGLGVAAGMALPGIFKGIGSACKWTYNNILAPVGKFIGNCVVGAWNGIKKLWNKIF